MKQKITIILCLTLLFNLAGCSNDSGKFKVVDGKELFFNGNEQVIDKLVNFENNQYYIKEDGSKAKNEWIIIDNDNTYSYFGAKGIMVKDDAREINGQLYLFDRDGKLLTDGLKEFGGYYYYATKDGYLLKNQFKIMDGKDYYFKDDGRLAKVSTPSWVLNSNDNGLGDLRTGYYCLNEEGQRIKNTWQDDFYLQDDGLMAVDTWIGEGNNKVYVGTDGKKSTSMQEVKDLLTSIYNLGQQQTTSVNTYEPTWKQKFYIDEYEDYTDEKYLYAEFDGKMDNSVVTGRKCTFSFLVDDFPYIMIYEYGNMQVKKEMNYNISLRATNGTDYQFTGYMATDRIIIDDIGCELIMSCLKSSQSFKLIIKENNSYTYLKPTKYLVEVIPDNFASLYWK